MNSRFFFIFLNFLIFNNNFSSMLRNRKTLIFSNLISIIFGLLNNINKNKNIEQLNKNLKENLNKNNEFKKNLKNKNDEIEKLESELNILKEENKKIKSQLNENLNKNNKFNELSEKINHLELQNKNLKNKNDKIEKLESELNLLKEENNFSGDDSDEDLDLNYLKKAFDDATLKINEQSSIQAKKNIYYKEENEFLKKKIIEKEILIKKKDQKINEMSNFIANIQENLKKIKQNNNKIFKIENKINNADKINLDNFIRDLERKNQNGIAFSIIFKEIIKNKLKDELLLNKIDETILDIDNFLDQYKNN